MKCSMHKLLEDLTITDDNGNVWFEQKAGDEVLVLIGLCTKDEVAIGVEHGYAPFKIPRNIVSTIGKCCYEDEFVDLDEELKNKFLLEIKIDVKNKQESAKSYTKTYYLDEEDWNTIEDFINTKTK